MDRYVKTQTKVHSHKKNKQKCTALSKRVWTTIWACTVPASLHASAREAKGAMRDVLLVTLHTLLVQGTEVNMPSTWIQDLMRFHHESPEQVRSPSFQWMETHSFRKQTASDMYTESSKFFH
jgi:hypothetical protein